jgi:peptide/nickel transport system permease protein
MTDTRAAVAEGHDGYWVTVRRQFLGRRLNRASLGVILLLFGVAVVADFVASDLPLALEFDGELHLLPNLTRPAALRAYDNQRLLERMTENDWAIFPPVPWGYNSHDLDNVLSPPSAEHWLGTDDGGRDVMARVVHGARVSLAVGVLSVLVLISIGVLVGSVSAYFGGVLDLVLMRIVEIVHSVPTLLFLVTMLALIMPNGWWSVIAMMVVIGLVRWTDVARLVRGEILRIKTLEYVQAAHLLGMSHARVLIVHILPNAMSPVLVTATFAMASAILLEGALSFLGFGIPDDMASWGSLLNEVRSHTHAWWLAVFPGAAIFVTVTAYNLAGEGLRDAIDPRLRL